MSAFFTFTAENARIVDVPIMTYVEDDFDQLWRLMAETLDIFPLFPDRVSVRVWDILWSLVDRCETSAGSAGSMPSRVREAVHYIENSLNGPIRVQSIADAVGVTPTHLARLFRACFGTTVIAYIRWRRTQKARDLLLHTDIPIKQVADNVGFTDIQHLYKIFRAELGQTPGSVRAGEDCGGHRFAFDAQTVSRLQETARPSTVPALGD
jgi:AraC-like DNA-binding protein